MTQPVYLDNAATTPLAPVVLEAMRAQLESSYANPASTHLPGRDAAKTVAQGRAQVAALMGAQPDEVIWTSGATEANNLAIRGVADFYACQQRKPGHMITVRTEHKAVIDPMRDLERQGWRITWLDVDDRGHIDFDALAGAIAADTALISVMHVNNETGVIHDVVALGRLAQERGVTLHVDAAQSLGKLEVDVKKMGVDLLSASAHKLHGPKGMGALYVRQKPRARLMAQIRGGGQEQGLRSGTLAPHQIAGFAAACTLAASDMTREQARVAVLRDRLADALMQLPGVIRNGDAGCSVAGILNLSFAGVNGESLLAAVSGGDDALALSAGSACSAARAQSSHVLRAMGRDPALAAATLRLSIGRFNGEADVAVAIRKITREIKRLRALSPVWTPPLAQAS